MTFSKSLSVRLLLVSSALLLTSCASLEKDLHTKMQALEDSIRGYRVQYDSIPAGATIKCNGQPKGVAPFYKYYDLTAEQKKRQVLPLDSCHAIWPSGARTEVPSTIPIDRFPTFVHMVMERPSEAPAYEVDAANGVKILAERQKLLNDIGAAAGSMLALGVGIRELSKTPTSYGIKSAQTTQKFGSDPSRGGIKWNWVQSETPSIQLPNVQPKFAISRSASNHASLTPVFPASSCVGTIVAGTCLGKILPSSVPHFCAGQMIEGRCIGAVLLGE
jgi:hypothetical protein